MNKKRIGISFTSTNFIHYWQWMTEEDLGDDLEIVELSFIKNNKEEITTCHAFILTGGVDTDPSFFDGSKTYPLMPATFQTERDMFEARIYRYAMEQHLPLLGICRGLQLVNVLQGGGLIQDLGNGNTVHWKEREGEDKQHTVVIDKHSLLHAIVHTDAGTVNSAHHQAIDPNRIGDNLKANAWSSDPNHVIEGVEFSNKEAKPFMLCVQWHPERMKDRDSNPLSIELKRKFLSVIRNNKHIKA